MSCLPACAFATSYAPGLVALSVLLAALASHVALDLAGRTTTTAGRVQRVWLTVGALVMGVGIWSMHFVGMLALRVHDPQGHGGGAGARGWSPRRSASPSSRPPRRSGC